MQAEIAMVNNLTITILLKNPIILRDVSLMEVIRGLEGASTEMVERNKTIFFPGDPAERVYLIRRGAVRL